MIVLVCGSRDWADSGPVITALEKALIQAPTESLLHPDLFVIEGGARGADKMAGNWAIAKEGVLHHREPAKWGTYGKGAGPIRNQVMLDMVLAGVEAGDTAKVLAFKNGFDKTLVTGGTEDMCRRAVLSMIPVWKYGEGHWERLADHVGRLR